MKWKVNKQPLPKDGDIRTKRVFAWKKTRVGEYYVWLETYEVTEKYFVSCGGNMSRWTEIKREVLNYVY
jgi:hypothetical protein